MNSSRGSTKLKKNFFSHMNHFLWFTQKSLFKTIRFSKMCSNYYCFSFSIYFDGCCNFYWNSKFCWFFFHIIPDPYLHTCVKQFYGAPIHNNHILIIFQVLCAVFCYCNPTVLFLFLSTIMNNRVCRFSKVF